MVFLGAADVRGGWMEESGAWEERKTFSKYLFNTLEAVRKGRRQKSASLENGILQDPRLSNESRSKPYLKS